MTMASTNGTAVVVEIGANAVTGLRTSTIAYARETKEITAHGDTAKKYVPVLGNHSFNLQGWYDDTATTGNSTVVKAGAEAGATYTIKRYPEGKVNTNPMETFSAVLTNYTETDPVDDIVTWTADFQISGEIDLGTYTTP